MHRNDRDRRRETFLSFHALLPNRSAHFFNIARLYSGLTLLTAGNSSLRPYGLHASIMIQELTRSFAALCSGVTVGLRSLAGTSTISDCRFGSQREATAHNTSLMLVISISSSTTTIMRVSRPPSR